MPVITDKIKKLLGEKNLSQRQLALRINYNRGALGHMINSECSFSNEVIQKIAPILEVSPEDIRGWIIAEKYPKDILKMAVSAKEKTPQEKGKLILTIKIDELLKTKGLSRTGLSKVIGYSQGKLNEMVIGKEPMSPLVMARIATVLEVSQDEITSWSVADKYSLETLQTALAC